MTKIIALLLLSLGAGFILSTITALIWYTFDDHLAGLTGVPALGEVPFWNIPMRARR